MDKMLLYGELEDFMHWLAWQNVDTRKAMMNHDDIFGELQIEFVKALNTYGKLPKVEFIKVTKRMCDNRISELKYKYYRTHRGLPDLVSLDSLFPNEALSDGFSIEAYAESKDFVKEIRDLLANVELEIFDMIVYGDDRLGELIRLSGMRSGCVYRSRGTVRIKSWHIADVLTISVQEVREHLSNIEEIVRSKL